MTPNGCVSLELAKAGTGATMVQAPGIEPGAVPSPSGSPHPAHNAGTCFFTTARSPSFLRQFWNANEESTRSMSFSERPRNASA